MSRLRCALLDDFQAVGTSLADWSPVEERIDVGNVRDAPLGSILNGTAMTAAQTHIRTVVVARDGGDEDDDDSGDDGCNPVGDGECSPGFPSSSCSPRN
ncbi:hypothetical protein ITI46_20370 [Streptomyces oryzae]|uniref:Uncharacterized protein n=1 Tax=Streptomyces oryzae TaxID=1434886 RepID=A0ABS3XF34_9ACTN|nr:hypothetical protein [Streptomyces oryzae]MBO8194000.1 hypothetical protein [Streptomyces oryzae]